MTRTSWSRPTRRRRNSTPSDQDVLEASARQPVPLYGYEKILEAVRLAAARQAEAV